jgi:hypothetical protein
MTSYATISCAIFDLSLQGEMTVAGDQDEPDDKVVTVQERVELIRAFRRIESAKLRRKIINLAKTLAPKEK